MRKLPVFIYIVFTFSVAGALDWFANAGADDPAGPDADGATRVLATVRGGHETHPVDRGRPVVLVAGALGVTPEVFREAFSRVMPAPEGQRPDEQRVRQNKSVLMAALAPHGITNERLDEVSNYYRYRPGHGEMWPTAPATVYAWVKDGTITRFEVAEAGSGYSSSPTIEVPGVSAETVVKLAFGKDFAKNGAIESVSLKPARLE